MAATVVQGRLVAMADAPFDNVITTIDAVRELYRHPSDLVRRKKIGVLDEGCRAVIAATPLVLVGTSAPDGTCEVSPRGGPAGFVQVIDDHRLAIPDLSGNNLIDTITNIVANPHVGLLFVLPGRDETLRVNGRAWLTTDDAVLDGFTAELKRPKAAIGVEVTTAFVHCAKSFRRGQVWDADELDARRRAVGGRAADVPHRARRDARAAGRQPRGRVRPRPRGRARLTPQPNDAARRVVLGARARDELGDGRDVGDAGHRVAGAPDVAPAARARRPAAVQRLRRVGRDVGRQGVGVESGGDERRPQDARRQAGDGARQEHVVELAGDEHVLVARRRHALARSR